MISALTWIKKGAAKQIPDKYTLTDEEYNRISNLTNQHVEDAKNDLNEAMMTDGDKTTVEAAAAKPAENNADPELSEYHLENYDKEESTEHGPQIFSNLAGLTYYSSNKEDPYITFKDEDEIEEELKELEILPTDNLLVSAKTEDDVSHLEVYTYIEEEDNLYIHHDIMLPAFPLALEWLDFKIGHKANEPGTGNYIAVGTFDPTIEIWDLDTVDAMYPEVILGETTKRGKKAKRVNNERHVAAVMGLSWNKSHRNLLVSGSADTTVKLWDIQTAKCMHSYNHHTDKVQAVQWNPVESTVLLTGSYDKRVCCLDSRSPDAVSEWKLTADVECMKWNPHRPELFYVSTEDGVVKCFDARTNNSKELFTLHAHDGPVSSLDVSPLISDCIITGSVDKQVRIWDIANNKPTCVLSRNLDVGKVFSANFSLDSPFLAAVAGSKGKVAIWNLIDNAGVRNAFGQRTVVPVNTEITNKSEEIITLPDDKEPESEDENEEKEKGMEVDGDDDGDDDEESSDNV